MGSSIVLWHTPGSCSRVTMSALEEIGLEFEDRCVDIFRGEQHSAEFTALNPKGKVPALLILQRVHTESAAILFFLKAQYPTAHLMPAEPKCIPRYQGLEDLVWFSSTIHPMVRQVRNPIRFTEGDTDGVRAHGIKHLTGVFDHIAERLSGTRWWFGDDWSIHDVYLYWLYSTAASGGMDLSFWPALASHATRVRARPSFVRSLARENAALVRHNVVLPPGIKL